MNILVTGAAGFVGRHLARELRAHGHLVAGVDRARTGDPTILTADLLKHELAPDWLDRFDLVVHLAAQVGRLFGEDDVRRSVIDNAAVTARLARLCGERGLRLAYASTSEVYGDRGDRTCYEDEPLDPGLLPHNVYGLSKRWGEEACRLYAPERLTVWRISMPYGPGLPAGRGRAAIVNFLDQAERRAEIPVHRASERSWCWIGDTVRGLRLTLEQPQGGVYNVGRDDDPRPLRDVAAIACDLTGAPHSLILDVDPPARQTVVKRLSTAKLRALGWRPQVGLEDGMARTLAALRNGRLVAR